MLHLQDQNKTQSYLTNQTNNKSIYINIRDIMNGYVKLGVEIIIGVILLLLFDDTIFNVAYNNMITHFLFFLIYYAIFQIFWHVLIECYIYFKKRK